MTNVEPFREFNFLPNLPKPNLDDRTFEDLVQECILRIPRYCPEWTNHNPGDPGITLIELFAWLTDHMLYRFNQVPRRYYIAFLELLGITLQPPTPAHTELTFSLTRAQSSPLRIAAGTEVATLRTETEPAIVFTSDRDLIIGQPRIQSYFVSNLKEDRPTNLSPIGENGQLTETLTLFPRCEPNDCFYLLLHPSEPDSVEGIPNQIFGNVLAFTFRGAIAGTTNIDPNHPPRDWQAWNGERWVSGILKEDQTKGFSFSEFGQSSNNDNADVVLHLPQNWAIEEFSGHRGHWIRCVYTTPRNGQHSYNRSPQITSVTVRSIGGTLQQQIRDRARLEPWGKQVLRSDPRHFAPSVLATDLEPMRLPEQQYGRVPPVGTEIWMHSYRVGGGSRGNVDATKLTVLKTAIPYVKSVTNHKKAQGGQESESLEEAVMRVPRMLRNSDVAVTPENFEAIAQGHQNIYRAHCPPTCETPGEVKLLIVGDPRPQREFGEIEFRAEFPNGIYPDQQLIPASKIKAELQKELDKRKPLGIKVLLEEPSYTGVKVIAGVKLEPRFALSSMRDEICDRICSKLYYFLNPITGGFDCKGWELGRSVTTSDIIAVLQKMPEVQYIGAVKLFSIHRDLEQHWYRLSLAPELVITSRRFGLVSSWNDSTIDTAHEIEILNA